MAVHVYVFVLGSRHLQLQCLKCFLVEMSGLIFVGGLFHSLVVVAYSEWQVSMMTMGSLAESAYVGQWVTQRNGVGLGGKAERGREKELR